MPGAPGDKRAQFARIAARIREEAMAGTWAQGQRLPSEHELAAAYGVSRGTIVRALDVLRAEGTVETVHGQGSLIASVPRVTVVTIGPADTAAARVPEDAERDALRMAPGVPLLVVTRPGGGGPELYDAAATILRGRG